MSARLAKVILLTAFSLVAVAVVMQRQRVANLYRFVVFDEPYINRTLNTSRRVVSQTDAVFDQIARNADFDDRRGHIPAFDLPLSEQVSLTPTATGLAAYKGFLERYSAIIDTAPGKYPSDQRAFDIMGLVNGYYRANLSNKRTVADSVFANEKDYRAEDFVYYLVNAQTACGTVGEATVALMRNAGFKARLLRFSRDWKPVTANHIFPEFYSAEQSRWVMLDPMINASPKNASGGLSAMEMMADPTARETMNRIWNGGMKYTDDGIVWFDRKGPLTDIYYFSDDPATRTKLGKSIAP